MRARTDAPRDVPADGGETSRDAGFSLVELLVAMGLFGVLGTLLLGLTLSTGKVTDDVRALSNINEESRLAVERLSRELRQATQVTAVSLPAAVATDPTALTFWTDFDGNGTQDLNAADPEIMTYLWDPQTDRLSLTVNDASGAAITRPLLAANVSALTLDLRSSEWEFDANGDGKTTWQELDATAAGGNGNSKPDGPELLRLDLVGVTMTVLDGRHAQTYTTRVDLRNRG
jgi:prepilin-type N-terminal cleavage/methylation domain-containing protein